MICFNHLKHLSKCISSNYILNTYSGHRLSAIIGIKCRQLSDKTPEKSTPIPGLMEFFDDPKMWGESEVKTGREWREDELRIKSNSDLHKLWYVLYKELNMLKTMEEAAKDQLEVFPSPERIDKVEVSMKNIETVVRERNNAYWELEVGEGMTGERPRHFRKDIFGRFRWMGCSEHLIPYRMNTKWRALNAPGFGPDVRDFIRKLKEKQMVRKKAIKFRQTLYVRQLLRRFPDVDTEYLKELYPEVDIEDQKKNLDEYISSKRWRPFHRLLYDANKSNKNHENR